MSFKPLMKTYGDPKYYPNGLAFSTADEAHQYGRQHKVRTWMLAEDYQVVESTEPVNYAWENGVGLIAVPADLQLDGDA